MITYEETKVPILHVTAQVMKTDGKPTAYYLQPMAGYLLHDGATDVYVSKNGEEQRVPRYRASKIGIGVSYPFTETQGVDCNGETVTMYGARELYTLPIDRVPSNYLL